MRYFVHDLPIKLQSKKGRKDNLESICRLFWLGAIDVHIPIFLCLVGENRFPVAHESFCGRRAEEGFFNLSSTLAAHFVFLPPVWDAKFLHSGVERAGLQG